MRYFFFKVPEMESTLVIISAHGWDLRENIPKMLPTASSHLLWQVQLSPMGWGAPSVWSREGNGNPLHCSCLENPGDGGAWWAAVYGIAQSQTRLKRLSSSSAWRDPIKYTETYIPFLSDNSQEVTHE